MSQLSPCPWCGNRLWLQDAAGPLACPSCRRRLPGKKGDPPAQKWFVHLWERAGRSARWSAAVLAFVLLAGSIWILFRGRSRLFHAGTLFSQSDQHAAVSAAKLQTLDRRARWSKLLQLAGKTAKIQMDAQKDARDFDVQREVLKDWAFWLSQAVQYGKPEDMGTPLQPFLLDCRRAVDEARRSPHLAADESAPSGVLNWLLALRPAAPRATRLGEAVGSEQLIGVAPTPDEILSGSARPKIVLMSFNKPSVVIVVLRSSPPPAPGHPDWRPGSPTAAAKAAVVLEPRVTEGELRRFEAAHPDLAYPHRLAAAATMDRLERRAVGARTPAARAELLARIATELRTARRFTRSQVGKGLCDAQELRLTRLVGRV